ncbi:MAG: hypothetical protein AAGF87_09280 [Bacteroidota bacterium]
MDRLVFECHRLNSGGCRVVDAGRPGMLARGIAEGGAADRASLSRLNEMLEQDPENPGLEFTLDAGHWLISGQGQIAIGGADMNWRINGRPAELYTIIDLDGDYLLQGGVAERGVRAYIAVKGEWQKLQRVWGSVSPGVPGIDTCAVGMIFEVTSAGRAPYASDLELDQHLPKLPLKLSVLPAPEWSWLSAEEQTRLLTTIWSVAPASNQQGLRLAPTDQKIESPNSPRPKIQKWNASGYFPGQGSGARSAQERHLISSPVLPGTVQYPPGGEPILLLRQAQTVGGYPRVLILNTMQDLDLLGQVSLGDGLIFQTVYSL